jgi:hypothetical protein
MKIGTNLILIGILSMLIGSAFASPLLISELEIRPYNEPLPKGPTADISASVVYANFSVGDTSVVYNRNVTDLSYFVVLNITNNSDEWAVVNQVNFDAAEKITKGISSDSPCFGENWTSSLGWEAKSAWVDGKWYNLTWVPHSHFWINCSSIIYGEEMWGEGLMMGEGYWMEGVQLKDKYVGGTLSNIYMNMNGTWVDVTGRITWLDDTGNIIAIHPERMDTHTSKAVTSSGVLFSEMKFLGRANIGVATTYVVSNDGEVIEVVNGEILHASITTNVTLGFSNLWAPHQSRLIAISTNRRILSELVEPSRLELLETGPIAFRLRVHHRLNGTLGIYESSSFSDEIKSVQMELTEDGYLYNIILSEDQMFVMDSFGVEVFIEPRS